MPADLWLEQALKRPEISGGIERALHDAEYISFFGTNELFRTLWSVGHQPKDKGLEIAEIDIVVYGVADGMTNAVGCLWSFKVPLKTNQDWSKACPMGFWGERTWNIDPKVFKAEVTVKAHPGHTCCSVKVFGPGPDLLSEQVFDIGSSPRQ